MRDAELLVRYYAFKNFVSNYRGNLKAFLDMTCKVLNSEWDDREAKIRAQVDDLERAPETTFKIFGDDAFKKWDGWAYEKRFNRAVFDVMTYYFSQKRVRRAALKSRKRVASAFRALCDRNADFKRSLETTTKSIEATTTRLQVWGKTLRRRLNVPTAIPTVGTRQMES
jgi:hypothetical protein